MPLPKNLIWGTLRLALGLGLVFVLLYRVHRGARLAEFRAAPAGVEAGAIYADAAEPALRFLVLERTDSGGRLLTLITGGPGGPVRDTGTLTLVEGRGPGAIPWTGVTVRPGGLALMGRSVGGAAGRWPLLLAALALFAGCIAACTARWKQILDAMDLEVGWRDAWAFSLIGLFFNAFMLGATGGDAVKAYCVAHASARRKAEAAASVFIDRSVGLLSIFAFAAAVMYWRLGFFRSHPLTRSALAVVTTGLAVLLAGLGALALGRARLRRDDSRKPAARSRAADIARRVYAAASLCLTHPGLLARTVLLSLANFAFLILIMFAVGRALRIELPLRDYVTLGPVVNLAACLPLTPGGLGLREYASVAFFGVAGVPAVQALPLSILLYATGLVWSLAGGLVFLRRRRARAAAQPAEDGRGEPR